MFLEVAGGSGGMQSAQWDACFGALGQVFASVRLGLHTKPVWHLPCSLDHVNPFPCDMEYSILLLLTSPLFRRTPTVTLTILIKYWQNRFKIIAYMSNKSRGLTSEKQNKRHGNAHKHRTWLVMLWYYGSIRDCSGLFPDYSDLFRYYSELFHAQSIVIHYYMEPFHDYSLSFWTIWRTPWWI